MENRVIQHGLSGRGLLKIILSKLGYKISRVPVDGGCSLRESEWNDQCNYLKSSISVNDAELDKQVQAEFEVHTVQQLTIEELLILSAQTVDRTDLVLGKLSQLEHSLQLAFLFRDLGTSWVLAALLHDLGKAAAVFHPKYSLNIFGAANVLSVGSHFGEEGIHLRYSHSEWAYLRFKDLIPEEVANLIRYHNVCPEALKIIRQRNSELARRIDIFKEVETHSKEKFGESISFSDALNILKPLFSSKAFSV